jgi:hypothetical protein
VRNDAGCDTPLPLKWRGFLGQPHQCGACRPAALSEPENIARGIFIAICDIATRTPKHPHRQREMQRDLSTGMTRSRCVGGIDEHHFTASVCSFAGEVCSEQAPSGIEDAFGQMMILDHVTDTQVFDRHTVVCREQPMAHFVEDIPTLVGNVLMLPLQHHHGLAAILSPLGPPGNPALGDTQPPLCSPVAGRMGHMLAIAGGDERRQPDIEANFTACRCQWCWANVAGEDRVPLPGFAGESQRLHRVWQPPVPPDSHTAYAGDFQAASINLEAVPCFFEAKAFETVFAFEARIPRLFPGFHTTEEGLKRFIEVLDNGLQHMAMYRSSKRIAGFVGFDLSELLVLADAALFGLIGILALSKTGIVPAATRFKGTIKPALLTL